MRKRKYDKSVDRDTLQAEIFRNEVPTGRIFMKNDEFSSEYVGWLERKCDALQGEIKSMMCCWNCKHRAILDNRVVCFKRLSSDYSCVNNSMWENINENKR